MALKLLDKLRPGEKGMIEKIRGKPEMHRRLSRLGMAVGNIVCVNNHRVFSNICLIIISIGSSTLSIDSTEAANVYVELI